MAEERENVKPEADYVKRQDEGDDVEGHWVRPAEAAEAAATEEPPDVEGHKLIPKHKP